MPLTFGGKRKPGGTGPRVPLTKGEQSLTDAIAKALRALQQAIEGEQYVQAIEDLDPDLLESLLFDVNIDRLAEAIKNALRQFIMRGGTRQAREIIQSSPRVGGNPMSQLEYSGQRLPSGIILPGSPAPVPAGLEFVIEAPVDRMFTTINQRATDYATTRSAQLIREVDNSNRLAIRRIISEAFTGPTTVDDTARKLRTVVGLHSRWANAVLRFDDAQFRRLLETGLSTEEARARAAVLSKRYRDKLIRRRAEMIARTELMQAENFGRFASWEAADRVGLMDPGMRKRWVTAPLGSSYGPPCEECKAMAAYSMDNPVPWNGAFPNGLSMPPAHPHCRCTSVLVPPSRGLVGLPSQDVKPWLDRLDELEAEDAAA